MRRARAAALAALWGAAGALGCGAGSGDGGTPPADGWSPPADGGSCAAVALEIGRCVAATGGPCTGGAGEVPSFAPLAEGDPVELVVGPQGSGMLAMAARTTGIVPGDPTQPASTDNPLVELTVVRAGGAGELVAFYRARVAFSPDPAGGGALVAPALFVVMDASDVWPGAALTIAGTVEDRDGVRVCGNVGVVVAP